MIPDLVDVGRIGGKGARPGNGLRGAERGAAELHGAFGDRIDMAVEFGAKAVEHLMHGDELRTLYIPMRLLGDEGEVDRLGQAAVQYLDRALAGVGLQVVLRFMHRHARLLEVLEYRDKPAT